MHDAQQVIHFYDDDVDAIPDVLTAEVTLQNGIPVARYFVPKPITPGAELYARHFEALKLAEAYRKLAAGVMGETVREARLATEQVAKWPSILNSTATELQVLWGNNEAKVALLRALALRIDVVKVLLSP